jgi:hypothetical protein
MQWKYKILRFDQYTSSGYKGVEDALNEHGAEGWEFDRFIQLNGFDYMVFRQQAQ